MKFSILLLACVLFLQESFSQTNNPVVKFNGIDTFLLGDRKAKFGKDLIYMKGGNFEGNFEWKGNTYKTYGFDSTFAGTLSIVTIELRFLMLNFLGDSVLSDFDLYNLYGCKSCRFNFDNGQEHFQVINNYLAAQLGKKGKYKNYAKEGNYNNSPISKKYVYYGYEWYKKDNIIKLTMQYTFDDPKKICAIDLYFVNKTLSPQK